MTIMRMQVGMRVPEAVDEGLSFLSGNAGNASTISSTNSKPDFCADLRIRKYTFRETEDAGRRNIG
jgi:hypothetical protein